MAVLTFSSLTAAYSAGKVMIEVARGMRSAMIEYNESVTQRKEREEIQLWATVIELAASISIVATATFLTLGVLHSSAIQISLSLFSLMLSIDLKIGAKNMHDRLGNFTNWIITSGEEGEKVRYFFYNLKSSVQNSFFLKHVVNFIEIDTNCVVLEKENV